MYIIKQKNVERVHINKHYAGITHKFHSPLLTVLVDFLDDMFNALLQIYFREWNFCGVVFT